MQEFSIGVQISELRKAKNITQEALARAIGVSGQAVSKWESGGSPDIALLPALADFFGVAIDRLFGREAGNYENIEMSVRHYIAEPLDANETRPGEWAEDAMEAAFERAWRLCWAVMLGMMGTKVFDKVGVTFMQIFEEMTKKGDDDDPVYGHILYEKGMMLSSTKQKLPYFLLMPEPPKGWETALFPQEECRKAFAALGDGDVLNALFFLHAKEKNSKFSAKYFTKNTGITEENAPRVLEMLIEMKFLKSTFIELDDTRQEIYEFTPRDCFLGVLALMQAFNAPPQMMIIQGDSRKKPLFTTGGNI
ncbi:MAG: helix-turn-helix domain-containing protein [Defluviitaleaceae bacterium]|nr:helix-turn-helix domain-containing protein [Defluviitaleaceae bacterium]MCL2273941.1 helix-turn-helix domain-containing protein [Defluviitaleaceae bacterium]